jgi:hypothetical protein
MQITATLAMLSTAATILVAAAVPGAAFNATQQYPYCSVNSATSGANCYVGSLDQCDRDHMCAPNPGYIGGVRAQGSLTVPKRH